MINKNDMLFNIIRATAPNYSDEQIYESIKSWNKEFPQKKQKDKKMNNELFQEANKMLNNLVSKELNNNSGTSDQILSNVPKIENLRTYRQGNYTVVLVNDDFIGVSKRCCKDKYNRSTGTNKALYRAIRGLFKTSQR